MPVFIRAGKNLLKIGKKYYSDFEWNGKRIRRALSPDKRSAENKLQELLALRQSEKHGLIHKDISWNIFKDRYLSYVQANSTATNSPNTFYRAKRYLSVMESTIPVKKLSDVSPEYLERLRARLMSEPYKNGKPATVSVIGAILVEVKISMHKAEEWGYIKPQNWRAVKVDVPLRKLHFYTMDELRKILAVTYGQFKTAILLMGMAGMRSGEVRHLEWGDVDFIRNRIHIQAKPHFNWRPKGSKRGRPPKERWIPMLYSVKSHLESIALKDGFVFGPKQYIASHFAKKIKKIIEKAELKGSAHTFRHTFASQLVSHGASLEQVGELLGHSDPKTTKIYAHLLPDVAEKAIERMPEL
jgi:integrase